MEACYLRLQPRLAIRPWGQKKTHHVVFNSSHRRTTDCPNHDQKLKAAPSGDYNLLGMSCFVDLHQEFPEPAWSILKDSPETIGKKELNWSKRSDEIVLDSKFADSVVFDKTLYKYAILGCKTNANRIMNEGLISSCDRDRINHSLENIEDDIERGRFEWTDDADLYINIVGALVDKLGDHLPKYIAMDSKHDSCLMILETWCNYYIDQIITQTKQLQSALLVLAIRSDGLVLPEDNTLLENLLLPIIKVLEQDASDLQCLLGPIYSSSDDVTFLIDRDKRFIITDFATLINYRFHGDLMQLLVKFLPCKNWLSVTPYDDEATMFDTMHIKFNHANQTRNRRSFALSKCLKVRCDTPLGGPPQDYEIEDAKYYLFSGVNLVLEMLDLSTSLVKNMSSKLEKVKIPLPPRGYGDIIGFAHLLASKGIALETAYDVVHLCLEKQVQPYELTLDQLRQINFTCDRAHDLLQDKIGVFGDLTYRDAYMVLIKWSCRLRIGPEMIRR